MFIEKYFQLFSQVINDLDYNNIYNFVKIIKKIQTNKGRLFFLGNGGSSANCSHAVNDFRKITEIESYNITDGISELTARANDEGFEKIFDSWLKISQLNSDDCIIILSVGGGDKNKNISQNIINAIDYAKSVGSKILSIVGRDGGYSAKNSDYTIIIPTVDVNFITPFVESMQSVILHLLVSHPLLKINQTTWECKK